MKMSDIKIGMSMNTIKEMTRDTENIFLSPLPSFMATEYKSVRNIDTKEEIFILFQNDIAIDITKNANKAIDWKQSRKTLDFILDN